MRLLRPRRCLQAALLLSLGHAATACAQSANLAITSTGQGQVDFSSATLGELSGITYLGGDSYIVVSDTNGKMTQATIVIDRTTGQITSASLASPTISVAGGNDLEGIAYDPRDHSLLISDENGNTITRHLIADGSQTGSITVPGIFASARSNLGLESLSLSPVDFNLWTANEEALTVDGPRSTNTQGTLVRLQRFDSSGQSVAQFGYLTQPHSGGSLVSPQSGVSDLVALPNGGLIVMEREVGGAFPSFRNRLYLIDAASATDTSNTASLNGVNTGLVEKELLRQVDAGFSNFEGITLGPMLSNGDYALVLVSDNGGGSGFNPQNLLALRLTGLAVEGDLNGDFVVDQQDLAVVFGAWGDSVTTGDRLAGDLSGDGQVGVADLDLVLKNWQLTAPITASVPEPGTATVGIGLALLSRWRW